MGYGTRSIPDPRAEAPIAPWFGAYASRWRWTRMEPREAPRISRRGVDAPEQEETREPRSAFQAPVPTHAPARLGRNCRGGDVARQDARRIRRDAVRPEYA